MSLVRAIFAVMLLAFAGAGGGLGTPASASLQTAVHVQNETAAEDDCGADYGTLKSGCCSFAGCASAAALAAIMPAAPFSAVPARLGAYDAQQIRGRSLAPEPGPPKPLA